MLDITRRRYCCDSPCEIVTAHLRRLARDLRLAAEHLPDPEAVIALAAECDDRAGTPPPLPPHRPRRLCGPDNAFRQSWKR